MNESAKNELARLIIKAGFGDAKYADCTFTPKEGAYVLACSIAGGDEMAIAALNSILKK